MQGSGSARHRAAPSRFMVTPLTGGRDPVYVGDSVTAPCSGWDGVYSGKVASINEADKTVHIIFDDGDEDKRVALRCVRHAGGAEVKLPKRGKRPAGVVMRRPEPKKLRLPTHPPGAKKERRWAHHGFTTMAITPPPPGAFPYDDLAKRTVFWYCWTWEKEPVPTVFPASRIGKVSLYDMVNELETPYSGLHVAALRYWYIQLATTNAAMTQPAVNHVFGDYDPYA